MPLPSLSAENAKHDASSPAWASPSPLLTASTSGHASLHASDHVPVGTSRRPSASSPFNADASSSASSASPCEPFLTLNDVDAHQILEIGETFSARVDSNGKILAMTASSAALFGYPSAYLAQVSLPDLTLPEYALKLKLLLKSAACGGDTERLLVQFARADADCFWLQLSAKALPAGTPGQAPGNPTLLLAGQEVTQWIETEQALREDARKDPLTGSGNRTLMRDWIRDAIAAYPLEQDSFAVALLDMDGFKRINDSLGHDAGDEVLCAISDRLGALVRHHDAVARFGGDEFVLLLRHIAGRQDAETIALRIVNAMQRPFAVAGRQVYLTASLGMAIYPDHGHDDVSLLKHADLAMYRAKEGGKNQFVVYSAERDAGKTDLYALELDMFDAVKAGEFELHYQPIVDPRTRTVRAAEALMRWTSANGPVGPAVFIPLAEDNGLIHLLGSWAIRTACAQMAKWDATGRHLAYVTVNVSPVQLHHPSFPPSVHKAIRESGLAPHRLMLEITEGTLMKNPDAAGDVLSALSAFGVRFAIDDFGTGYSNLAYLRKFPLAALKIDRSFVSDMPHSNHDRAIVSAVLSLAKELDLEAIAEGVESESQRDLLIERGCEYTQGWLYAKALTADEFEAVVGSTSLVLSAQAPLRALAIETFD